MKNLILALILAFSLSGYAEAVGPHGNSGGKGDTGSGVSDITEIKSGANLLARQHKTTAGKTFKIEIFGDTTNKPDEGDTAVSGTVQWAADILTVQGEAGTIELVGGDDYQFATQLSITGTGAHGIRIVCTFGKDSWTIKPTANLTPMWAIGDGTDPIKDFWIKDCPFYGASDAANTSSGIVYNDLSTSKFIGNDMVQFLGDSFTLTGDGTGNSTLNRVINNNIYLCGAACIEGNGAGGNSDHFFIGNWLGTDTSHLGTDETFFWNSPGGGHKMSGNHILGRDGSGCIKIIASTKWMISDLFLDTCEADQYADLAFSNSTMRGVVVYQDDDADTQTGVLLQATALDNVVEVTCLEPGATNKIVDCLLILGDRNIVTVVADGMSDDGIQINSGATDNVVVSIQTSNIGGSAIENSGGATNVQLSSAAIP